MSSAKFEIGSPDPVPAPYRMLLRMEDSKFTFFLTNTHVFFSGLEDESVEIFALGSVPLRSWLLNMGFELISPSDKAVIEVTTSVYKKKFDEITFIVQTLNEDDHRKAIKIHHTINEIGKTEGPVKVENLKHLWTFGWVMLSN